MAEEPGWSIIPMIRRRAIACFVLAAANIVFHFWAWDVVAMTFGPYEADNNRPLTGVTTLLLGAVTYLIPACLVSSLLAGKSYRVRRAGVVWVFRCYLVAWLGLLIQAMIAFANGPPL